MKDFLLNLEGRGKDDVISKIESVGLGYRITREDSTNYMITCDFDMQRINLEIDKGVVVSAELG